MKYKLKVLSIILLLVILIIPATAFANSPAPDPNKHRILIDDITNIEEISVYGYDSHGVQELIASYDREEIEELMRTRIKNERIIKVHNEGGVYTHLQLFLVNSDDKVRETELVELSEEIYFSYDVRHNQFTKMYSFDSDVPGGFTLIGWIILLALPLGLTVLFEWLVALAFKIKPSKYVVFTNLVSNPIMNIIILIVMTSTMMNYFALLAILELSVIIAELFVYMLVYKEVGRVKLMLFAIASNAISFAAYALFDYMFIWI